MCYTCAVLHTRLRYFEEHRGFKIQLVEGKHYPGYPCVVYAKFNTSPSCWDPERYELFKAWLLGHDFKINPTSLKIKSSDCFIMLRHVYGIYYQQASQVEE